MAVCPQCHQRLIRTKSEAGCFYYCGKCKGRAVGLAVLRRAIPREYVQGLWLKARRQEKPQGKACPICHRSMAEVDVPAGQQPVLLDVCAGCQFVWFDPREFEQLPVQTREPTERERLPEKAREAIAMVQLKREAERARGADFGSGRAKGIRRAIRMLPLLVPLFVAALRRGETLVLAMEARNYSGGKGRTHLIHLKAQRADAVAVGLVVLLVAALIAAGTMHLDARLWHWIGF